MTPTVIFDFLGLTISIKIDSGSFCYRYLGHYNIYMLDDWQCKERYLPPAEVSVGVNSKELSFLFNLLLLCQKKI